MRIRLCCERYPDGLGYGTLEIPIKLRERASGTSAGNRGNPTGLLHCVLPRGQSRAERGGRQLSCVLTQQAHQLDLARSLDSIRAEQAATFGFV